MVAALRVRDGHLPKVGYGVSGFFKVLRADGGDVLLLPQVLVELPAQACRAAPGRDHILRS